MASSDRASYVRTVAWLLSRHPTLRRPVSITVVSAAHDRPMVTTGCLTPKVDAFVPCATRATSKPSLSLMSPS